LPEEADQATILPEDEDELGPFDLLSCRMSGLKVPMTRWSEWRGRWIRSTTGCGEGTSSLANPVPQVCRHRKPIFNSAANDIDEFTDRLNADVPSLSKSFHEAMDAVTRGLLLAEDFQMNNEDDRIALRDTRDRMAELTQTITQTRKQMLGMPDAVVGIPPVTSIVR
jgi:hypothetical protein